MEMMIDPVEIKPLHPVTDKRLLRELIADMKDNGWQGRPLLVIERASGYLAWTGSHRIPAATKAGLISVPCYVLQEHQLLPYDCDAEWGHVMDYERLDILKKVGDEVALHIMWQEGRC
ncbi:MAG: ParB/RepB/Spo0J family partition protein [Verrucomicrobia bacterium]|nr:ParB/RepB/Spo0J family partition protein [Verrucomicrobiota bacterium]